MAKRRKAKKQVKAKVKRVKRKYTRRVVSDVVMAAPLPPGKYASRVTKVTEERGNLKVHFVPGADPKNYDHINPSHYVGENGIQVVNVIEAFAENDAHVAHAMTYLLRLGKKPDSNLRRDLKKALWWLMRKYQRMFGLKPNITIDAFLELRDDTTAASARRHTAAQTEGL